MFRLLAFLLKLLIFPSRIKAITKKYSDIIPESYTQFKLNAIKINQNLVSDQIDNFKAGVTSLIHIIADSIVIWVLFVLYQYYLVDSFTITKFIIWFVMVSFSINVLMALIHFMMCLIDYVRINKSISLHLKLFTNLDEKIAKIKTAFSLVPDGYNITIQREMLERILDNLYELKELDVEFMIEHILKDIALITRVIPMLPQKPSVEAIMKGGGAASMKGSDGDIDKAPANYESSLSIGSDQEKSTKVDDTIKEEPKTVAKPIVKPASKPVPKPTPRPTPKPAVKPTPTPTVEDNKQDA